MNPRLRTGLKWLGIGVGSLLLALLLAVAVMDWNWFKHPIERIASARAGRTIHIGGNLDAHIWSWTPSVTIDALTVGNPPWESGQPLLQVERLQLKLKLLPLFKGDIILPRVKLVRPVVYLHQEKSGRANWTFENQAPTLERASKPTHLPVVRDLLIEHGKLTLLDDLRKLRVQGTVEAHESASHNDPKAFLIEGRGTINAQPLQMSIAGGPLVNLDPEHPYPFDLNIAAGAIHVEADGHVLKPFDLAGLDFDVTLSGGDLAEFFYLTQLALPNTPPFRLRAHIERRGTKVAVTGIAGKVGSSDLGGQLNVDATRKRPMVTGELVSNQLRMSDTVASLGAKSKGPAPLEERQGTQSLTARSEKDQVTPAEADALLLPTAHLQTDRLRAMDADVRFHAKSIDAGSIPFKRVGMHVRLGDALLTLDPFTFDMPQGRLFGLARIDAREQVPHVKIDVRVKDIQLDQLKGKQPDASPPLTGVMQARAVIEGKGDSLHNVMSDANGTFTLILPNGEVRSAFAELTGVNVAKGLGLLLTDAHAKAPVRCGVAQFGIKQGTMHAENFIFDTQNVLIKGAGDIRLGPEELNLQIKGEPKKPRLTRLRTPIELTGHLRKPVIGVNAGSALKQGAMAAALGSVITPLAAVLAFVDPGLAKDQNCAELLAGTAQTAAERGAAPPPH